MKTKTITITDPINNDSYTIDQYGNEVSQPPDAYDYMNRHGNIYDRINFSWKSGVNTDDIIDYLDTLDSYELATHIIELATEIRRLKEIYNRKH